MIEFCVWILKQCLNAMLFDTYQTQNINRIYSGSGAVHGNITVIEQTRKQENKGCKCWNEHVVIAAHS